MAMNKLEPIVQSNPIYIGETIGQKYVVERMLAAGKSSTVFVAHTKHDARQERVALKVAPIENGQTDLDNDIAVLKSIDGKKYFAKIIGFVLHRQYKFLAMEQLGTSVNDIIHRPQIQKLCLSSVAKIGIQSLDALSTLHKAGFVHGKVSA
ncbi:MAG: hypothetical protein EZS28_022743, partial [Streblomastix strix]